MVQLYHCTCMLEELLKKKGETATGRSRKDLDTTMHIAISNDSVVTCKLFPAQRQDCKSFEELE